MTIKPGVLMTEILSGIAAGEVVIIPRQTFWHVAWPGKSPLTQEMGEFLAELRAKHCVQHKISFDGYEFTKAS